MKKRIQTVQEIKENKPKVQKRQSLEVKKIIEKQQVKEEKKQVNCYFLITMKFIIFFY